MNTKLFLRLFVAAVCLIGFGVLESQAANTYYVATNGTGNGDSWTSATNNIQGAVDRTVADDIVLVSNGVYNTGGTASIALTNRVYVNKAITLRSVNGAANTIIAGQPDSTSGTVGPAAVRCVLIDGANAVLDGFTLSNGYTRADGDYWRSQSGGGLYLYNGGTVSNCVIKGNIAEGYGGGSMVNGSGTISNCVISGNISRSAGGGAGGVIMGGGELVNCIVSNNSGYYGGGIGFVWGFSVLNNCRLVNNTSSSSGGGAYLAANGMMKNCLLANNSAGGGGGGFWLPAASLTSSIINCTIARNSSGAGGGGVFIEYPGAGLVTNSIIWGNTGAAPVNIRTNGAGSLSVFAYTCSDPVQPGTGNTSADPLFANMTAANYYLQSNSPCVNTGTNDSWMTNAVDLAGRPRIYNAIVDMGAYEYNPMIFYVATNGTGNGDSWASAANTIQAAVDRTQAGDTVLVSNGVYNTGGTKGSIALTNRVYVNKAITLRSMNGAANTIIAGQPDGTSGTVGTGAVRCVFFDGASNAVMSGFTLSNGYTRTDNSLWTDQSGGGMLLYNGGTVSNCVIKANKAYAWGGGIMINGSGTISNCVISSNAATAAGGAAGGVMLGGGEMANCIVSNNSAYYGGGIAFVTGYSVVNNCSVVFNTSAAPGGGAYLAANGMLRNCLLANNVAGNQGGGIWIPAAAISSSLINCTIARNWSALGGGGIFIQSPAAGYFTNSIIWGNTGAAPVNILTDSVSNSFAYTCSDPVQTGTGNTGADPKFVDADAGNYRLWGSSPCVNAGTNGVWTTSAVDLDGHTRILYGTVDMGAYEFVRRGSVFGFK